MQQTGAGLTQTLAYRQQAAGKSHGNTRHAKMGAVAAFDRRPSTLGAEALHVAQQSHWRNAVDTNRRGRAICDRSAVKFQEVSFFYFILKKV